MNAEHGCALEDQPLLVDTSQEALARQASQESPVLYESAPHDNWLR